MPVRPRDGTEDHPGPARAAIPRGREVLIAAFPTGRVLPVPVPGDAVGRDWLAAQGIPDGRVSGKHVVFHRHGTGLAVEDLGSRNGTFVEGRRIAPNERVQIDDGARLRIGRTLFVYREGFVGSDAPSPPLGDLVGPFGLRPIAAALEALRARPRENVLIEGPTGSGKELLAAYVAQQLGRARPYGAFNIAGVPAGVFESQLFGYVQGAYSGSGRGSEGLFLAHNGGTVFLDEIGELPLELQPKLLRFLESREIQPVGGTQTRKVNVLLLAATLRPLASLVQEGRFREDLLARLGAPIELPPLSERAEDLFAIMQALVRRRNEAYDPAQVEIEAIERLALYDWPGNVRRLATTLDAIAMHAPPPALPHWAVERVLGPLPAVESARSLSRQVAERMVEACGGNESEAARRLGISRGRLRRVLGRA